MQNIIAWLCNIEKRAGEIYTTAAERFKEDQEFSHFLSQLAQDEMAHYQMLTKAAENRVGPDHFPDLDIILDDETVGIVERPLTELLSNLQKKQITREDVLHCIAKAELSEWNEIFLYVIHSYSGKGQSRDIQYAAAAIQSHEERIKNFIQRLPDSINPGENFLTLPKIWDRNVLVVEDDEALRQLMSSILGTIGKVETAANGKEACNQTKDTFFDVIVSDIDMPEMNGLEFLNHAIQTDHRYNRHFIFCSGHVTQDRKELLQNYGIPYLPKPFNIFELQATAQKLLETVL